RVAAANPNTVVVVNSGLPVLMPWAADVPAIVQAWLPGQAFGEAIAAVLSGGAEPGGRLPVSMPRAEADSPVLRAQPDNGVLEYAEGLLVGYRGYDRAGRDPLFAFGHGLGYTEWEYESIAASETAVMVTVRNSGARAGREVVQVYSEAAGEDASRPVRVLAGFATVTAAPGERVEATIALHPRTFMGYDEEAPAWQRKSGAYTMRAGRSSRDLRLAAGIVVR